MTNKYRIYGITFSSSFPFKYELEESFDNSDLSFEYKGVNETYSIAGNEVSRYQSGNSMIKLYQSDTHETIVFPGVAAFECTPTTIRAICLSGDLEYLIEICFVGNVMSYWLERRGIIMLHASSVEIHGKAIVFMAGMNRGKTTVASAFVAAGFPLVTDDILSVRVKGASVTISPGFPQMKLLQEQLDLFEAIADDFEKIHPLFDKRRIPIGKGIGRYYNKELPLGCIYLIDHMGSNESPCSIVINKAEALINLLKNSFVAELLDSIDRGKPRLDKLSTIVQSAPLKRLQIPKGFNNLPNLIDFVTEDCLKEAL